MSKILILPDIHQDIPWAKTILESEKGNYDKVIILGDLYDSLEKPEKIASVSETAKFVMDLKQQLGDNLIVLIGNHDVPYYGIYEAARKHHKLHSIPYCCAGFSNNKAKEIAKVVDKEFIDSCKLCHIEDGILYSHAGLLSKFIQPFVTDGELPNYIENLCDEAWKNFPHVWNPLFEAGMSRGGNEVYGGITWCDLEEFDDVLPMPQIFGHSSTFSRAAKIGKSFCLDGMQQIHAIVENGVDISIKHSYGDIILFEKRAPTTDIEKKVSAGVSFILGNVSEKSSYKRNMKLKIY